MLKTAQVAIVAATLMALTLALPTLARAQDAPFAEEIRLFGIEDEVYPPDSCETLFVGSSSFRFWFAMQRDFRNLRILKRGFGGAQISDINHYFDQVAGRYRPARIAFYAGENDIDVGKTPAAALSDFTAFMDRKTAAIGATPVYFVSAKPSLARRAQLAQQSELNRLVRELADERDDLVYVDIVTAMLKNGEPDPQLFISDGLHMKAAGYRLWKDRISFAFRHADASRAPGC